MEYGGVDGLLAAWQVSHHTDVSLSWQWTDVPSSVCCVTLVFSKSEADDLSSETALTDLTHSPPCSLIISVNYSLYPPPLTHSLYCLFCFDLSLSVTVVHQVISFANIMSLSLLPITLSPQIPLHACPADA